MRAVVPRSPANEEIRITFSKAWGCWQAQRGLFESIGGSIEVVVRQAESWMRKGDETP